MVSLYNIKFLRMTSTATTGPTIPPRVLHRCGTRQVQTLIHAPFTHAFIFTTQTSGAAGTPSKGLIFNSATKLYIFGGQT